MRALNNEKFEYAMAIAWFNVTHTIVCIPSSWQNKPYMILLVIIAIALTIASKS